LGPSSWFCGSGFSVIFDTLRRKKTFGLGSSKRKKRKGKEKKKGERKEERRKKGVGCVYLCCVREGKEKKACITFAKS
jgi:hypothetical protein